MAILCIRRGGDIIQIPLVSTSARPALHIRGGGFDGNVALVPPESPYASPLRVRYGGAVYAVQGSYPAPNPDPDPPPQPPTPPQPKEPPKPFYSTIVGMWNNDETHYDMRTGRRLLGRGYAPEGKADRTTIPTPVSNVCLTIESGATGLWAFDYRPGHRQNATMYGTVILMGTGDAGEIRNPYTRCIMECSSDDARQGRADLNWLGEKDRYGNYPVLNAVTVYFNRTTGNIPSFRISCYHGAIY